MRLLVLVALASAALALPAAATTAGAPRASDAVWAPDEKTLAFGEQHRRVLVRRGVSAQWSPDGRWISFTADGTVQLVHPDGSARRTLAP